MTLLRSHDDVQRLEHEQRHGQGEFEIKSVTRRGSIRRTEYRLVLVAEDARDRVGGGLPRTVALRPGAYGRPVDERRFLPGLAQGLGQAFRADLGGKQALFTGKVSEMVNRWPDDRAAHTQTQERAP